MFIKITKQYIKKGHRRKGEKEYFIYRYVTIILFKIITISMGHIGLKKFDLRVEIKWGW